MTTRRRRSMPSNPSDFAPFSRDSITWRSSDSNASGLRAASAAITLSATRLQVAMTTVTLAARSARTKEVVPTRSATAYSFPSCSNDTTSSAKPSVSGSSVRFSMWRIVWSRSSTQMLPEDISVAAGGRHMVFECFGPPPAEGPPRQFVRSFVLREEPLRLLRLLQRAALLRGPTGGAERPSSSEGRSRGARRRQGVDGVERYCCGRPKN
mmetsp:Transcript_8230/g.33885  ORF Transcript_8230/g.33885 Transcript_8230/m.33885 type:complete len:210 (-) Transcript_8230:1-630(-)